MWKYSFFDRGTLKSSALIVIKCSIINYISNEKVHNTVHITEHITTHYAKTLNQIRKNLREFIENIVVICYTKNINLNSDKKYL